MCIRDSWHTNYVAPNLVGIKAALRAGLGVTARSVEPVSYTHLAMGELRRVHGGAVPVHSEPPITERVHTRVKYKRAIARAAAGLVSSGQTLFLDAGSTTSMLADELAKLSGLTIITNSFDVALKVGAAGSGANELLMLGGSVGGPVCATAGDITISEIHRYREMCIRDRSTCA